MPRILDAIESPADVKRLTPEQLPLLAGEIRQELVARVTANGGHLASNLGVVELTIVLHRVFDSPRDRIIWDVGHQSYVHKLLTGRRDLFATLRQEGGLSGFTSRAESGHDPFGAGHASTSVSAALGMAIARDLSGADNHIVPVIGDGSIAGGMALEAINHAGHLGSRLVVILNDNGMSISPTVGGLARMLNRVRFDNRYYLAKRQGKHLLEAVPMGDHLINLGKQVKSGLKSFMMPSVLWEELGFAYIGPVDGHDFAELEKALAQARDYRRKPAFVHVVTCKGKGYSPAESDAVYFHGIAPECGKKAIPPTYSEVFAATAGRLLREDPRVVVITPAMPEGNCLSQVKAEFPSRVFDVGICEQHAVTFAAGLATQGFVPIVAIYSTFLQRAFDQIIHDVCLQELPVVFAIDRAGIVGDDGKTHQGAFDLSYLSLVPNLIVAAPRDENELQSLLCTAVKSGRPMAVRYPRSPGLGVSLDAAPGVLPVGKGQLLWDGDDVALVAVGSMVAPALQAAVGLAEKGIEAAVVDARFVKPLDDGLILSVANKAKRIVTIEENALAGGFGSAVLRLLQSAGLTGIAVRLMGIPDEFVEQGAQAAMRSHYNLDAAGIMRQALSLVPARRSPVALPDG